MIHPSVVSTSCDADREYLWDRFISRFAKKRKWSAVRWFFLVDLLLLAYTAWALLSGNVQNAAGQPMMIALLLSSILLAGIPVLKREFRVFAKIGGFELAGIGRSAVIPIEERVRQVVQYIRVERIWYLLHGICWAVAFSVVRSLFSGSAQDSVHWSVDAVLFFLIAASIGLWYEYREHRLERDRLSLFLQQPDEKP